MEYTDDLARSDKNKQRNQALLQKWKRIRPKDLDDRFHEAHDAVFDEMDCLKCANCCKTTSPLFQEADIERLARALKMKVPDFIQNYLKRDDEGDYVLKQAPCPFLDGENHCMVYQDRPKACREYPHTNRKRMYQILDLTYKNTLVCPAVGRILDRLAK